MANVVQFGTSFNPLTLYRPPRRQTTFCELKATIVSNNSESNEHDDQELFQSTRRSRRRRTTKSLGLENSEPKIPRSAEVSPSEFPYMNVREGDERPVSSSESSTSSYNTPKFDGGTLRSGTNKEGFVSNVEGLEMTSVQDRATSNPTSELSERDIFNMENSNKARQWIQDMINADLERRYKSDDDDSDEQDPLFIEEDDPNWLDEPDDGWGFKVSDLFKEDFRVTNRRKYDKDDDDDVQDIPNTDWDFQPQNFSALDVDSMSWTQTVLHDPSPLVALIYERYGKRGRECYHVLRELEDAANRMWKSHVLPPRVGCIIPSGRLRQ